MLCLQLPGSGKWSMKLAGRVAVSLPFSTWGGKVGSEERDQSCRETSECAYKVTGLGDKMEEKKKSTFVIKHPIFSFRNLISLL